MTMRKNEAKWIESRQRWQINVQQDGERKTFTSSKPGKKGKIEAERAADEWLEDGIIENARLGPEWDKFLENKKATTGTANHRQHETMGRLWILPNIGKTKRLCKITDQNWQDCIDAAYKAGKSKKTCAHVRESIIAFCKFEKRSKKLRVVPDCLVVPRDAPVGQRKILQPSDLRTLFSSDTYTVRGKPKKAFYIHAWRLDALTGLRRGELCGLQKSDLDGAVLKIQRSVNEQCEITSGKNQNARRTLVLPRQALAEIDAQIEMLKRNGIASKWIFPDETGDMTDPKRMYAQWRNYRNSNGIQSTLHEIRHTYISIAKADVPEQLLKLAVGHSVTMDTFGVYGHEVDGEAERMATILEGVFDKLLG